MQLCAQTLARRSRSYFLLCLAPGSYTPLPKSCLRPFSCRRCGNDGQTPAPVGRGLHPPQRGPPLAAAFPLAAAPPDPQFQRSQPERASANPPSPVANSPITRPPAWGYESAWPEPSPPRPPPPAPRKRLLRPLPEPHVPASARLLPPSPVAVAGLWGRDPAALWDLPSARGSSAETSRSCPSRRRPSRLRQGSRQPSPSEQRAPPVTPEPSGCRGRGLSLPPSLLPFSQLSPPRRESGEGEGGREGGRAEDEMNYLIYLGLKPDPSSPPSSPPPPVWQAGSRSGSEPERRLRAERPPPHLPPQDRASLCLPVRHRARGLPPGGKTAPPRKGAPCWEAGGLLRAASGVPAGRSRVVAAQPSDVQVCT